MSERLNEATSQDEVRPVTALFADVVGSMGLGERLRPDEIKALIGEFVSRMSLAVEEHGGIVQAYSGDGIAAYFGVPFPHADDAERAARAALRIQQLAAQYERDVNEAWGLSGFSIRLGINTGPAGVGLVGGAEQQAVALGDSTNVAARLQATAEPGSIVVGGVTARLLAGRFELRSLGDLPLRGRHEPVEGWLLVGLRTDTPGEAPTPFVNRGAELGQLRVAVSELRDGASGIVVLIGEAGMGKSRLLDEARRSAGDAVAWLEGTCMSYGGTYLHWPFVEMLRRWLAVAEGDAGLAVRLAVSARLEPRVGDRRQLAALAKLLGIDIADRPPGEDSIEENVAVALATWLRALAAEGPLVVVLENADLADRESRRIAERLLVLVDEAPLLFVITLRPEPASEGWALRLRILADYLHRVREISLQPLSDDDSRALLGRLLPGVEEQDTRELVARAAGNPFYLGELARALAEGGTIRREFTVSPSPAVSLPPALEAVVRARIGRRSAKARRAAMIGAVVGRNFTSRLLRALDPDLDVKSALDELVRADIVREARRHPELEYAFRHPMLREAALAGLPQAGRRQLHRRAADAYAALHADNPDEFHDLMAHHSIEAGDLERALHHLELAAGHALRIGAEAHARDLLARAVRAAKRLDAPEAEQRLRVQLGRLGGVGEA